MIPQYNENEFAKCKSGTKLPLTCELCSTTFYREKRHIMQSINNSQRTIRFCSSKCKCLSSRTKQNIICSNCGVEFIIKFKEFKKSNNHFCSQSCATTYNNKHKITGNRRSKLEKYLENELTKLFPDLEIHFNRKDAINSELDIYIPSLKLAFELNGIFHYEPIYGQDKFNQIQNNDNRKFQACIENGVELCLIDVSQQKHFNEKTSMKYLTIIITIINCRLLIY